MGSMRNALIGLGLVCVVLSACSDSNLFSGLADETSAQAKLETAQAALDGGDCQTALTLFGELQAAEPDRVDRRLDLSASHLCQAGFDAKAFIEVAANFGSGTVTNEQVFQRIIEAAVSAIDASWPQDLSQAETLLADDLSPSPPLPFKNDPDAQFALAVVEAARVALTTGDLLHYVGGVVDCAASSSNCEVTAQDVADIVDALNDANGLLANLQASSVVRDSVETIVDDLNAVDGVSNNAVTCADLAAYWADQSIISNVSVVTCVP